MWSKLLLRQPASCFVRRTMYRFSSQNPGQGATEGAKWDKGAQGGEYRDSSRSEKRDVTGRPGQMSAQEEKMKAAPEYQRWNEGLDSKSKKSDEDKGSARWSREASEGKIDVETDNNSVSKGGVGAKPDKPTIHQQAERVDKDNTGFDQHSAGRVDETKSPKDMHAAGRFDEPYKGTKYKATPDIGSAKTHEQDTSRKPGSGLGNKPYSASTDSQWTQVTTDKEAWKSVEKARKEKTQTDQHATLNRWVDNNPASEKLKSRDELKDDKSKSKK